MTEIKANILVVEDDESLGFVIKDNLEIKGYDIRLCRDGKSGLESFINGSFDLCILDVMLPEKDGFSLARDIRKKDSHVPILFLTAKGMKEDRINGFQSGGDDYIVKPFSIEELILRMEVFLRRSKLRYNLNEEQIFTVGKFRFDPSNLLLESSNFKKRLTRKESDILLLFARNPEVVLKRHDILNTIWGDDDYFMGRSLDVFITRLRKYLKKDPSIKILNYHGVGFKLHFQK